MNRTHRTSRPALKYLLPSAVLTTGLVLGHTALTSSPAQPSARVSTTELDLANASMKSLPTVRDLGVVTGVLTIAAPPEANRGRLTAVVESVRGQVARKTAVAPSPVRISTRSLPVGTYTVTLHWAHDGKSSVVAISTFRVERRPRPKPTSTSTPAPTTPTAAPTTSAPTTPPTTAAPTSAPTTSAPTTTAPPTKPPSTTAPTTKPPATKPPASTPPVVVPTTTAPSSGFARQILDLTNAARKDNGCNTPLRLDTRLNTAAQRHSDDMVARNFFSHNGSDGSNPFERMTDAGYRWAGAAENIAAGNTTAAATMQQWLNSPGHRANILNCGLVDLGVGYTVGTGAEYAGYWVQDFGSPL